MVFSELGPDKCADLGRVKLGEKGEKKMAARWKMRGAGSAMTLIHVDIGRLSLDVTSAIRHAAKKPALVK
jgi:hypothetical protein